MMPKSSEAGRPPPGRLEVTTCGRPQALGALAKLLFKLHQQQQPRTVRVAARDGVAA
jgi:hypothetical protein